MPVSVPLDLVSRIDERVQRGDYKDSDSLIREAVLRLLEEDEHELREVREAVEQSVAEIARGESVSLQEFDRAMRLKHGIPH